MKQKRSAFDRVGAYTVYNGMARRRQQRRQQRRREPQEEKTPTTPPKKKHPYNIIAEYRALHETAVAERSENRSGAGRSGAGRRPLSAALVPLPVPASVAIRTSAAAPSPLLPPPAVPAPPVPSTASPSPITVAISVFWPSRRLPTTYTERVRLNVDHAVAFPRAAVMIAVVVRRLGPATASAHRERKKRKHIRFSFVSKIDFVSATDFVLSGTETKKIPTENKRFCFFRFARGIFVETKTNFPVKKKRSGFFSRRVFFFGTETNFPPEKMCEAQQNAGVSRERQWQQVPNDGKSTRERQRYTRGKQQRER